MSYKRKEVIGNCTLYLGDCLEVMPTLDKVGCVLTDPPYLYLDHKLDRKFNYIEWIEKINNVTKNDACFSFFGRGVSLSQWIVEADKQGFKFKEEVVWNKGNASNPMGRLMRQHELLYVFAKGDKCINKTHIDAFEKNKNCGDYYKFEQDLKKIVSKIRGLKSYEELVEFLKGNFNVKQNEKHNITVRTGVLTQDRDFKVLSKYEKGAVLSSLISVAREHYRAGHPTQKPIQLMKYLVELTSNKDDVILDTFMGSGSTLVACAKTGRHGIGIEIDEEYFNISCKRVEDAYRQGDLFI
jgi:site-specific DNA-methyltransferase (adenine-specific)